MLSPLRAWGQSLVRELRSCKLRGVAKKKKKKKKIVFEGRVVGSESRVHPMNFPKKAAILKANKYLM